MQSAIEKQTYIAAYCQHTTIDILWNCNWRATQIRSKWKLHSHCMFI